MCGPLLWDVPQTTKRSFFLSPQLHLLPASAIVHAPFSSLVAACATAGERGADLMEAIVAKTVTLKMDDPAVMPFVQNLLDHVSRTADTKTHDNFLKVRLLLSAVEAWRTQPQMVERILGQVGGFWFSIIHNDRYLTYSRLLVCVVTVTNGVVHDSHIV